MADNLTRDGICPKIHIGAIVCLNWWGPDLDHGLTLLGVQFLPAGQPHPDEGLLPSYQGAGLRLYPLSGR